MGYISIACWGTETRVGTANQSRHSQSEQRKISHGDNKKQAKCLKCGKTRMTKSRLVLVESDWSRIGASFRDQS